MAQQIQFRRGTAAQWSAANPILAQAEMGIETDTDQFKLGDGVTAWNSLSYGGIAGPPAAIDDAIVDGVTNRAPSQNAVFDALALKAPTSHVGARGVSQHDVATSSEAGFMSTADKTKLDGIASGATANDSNANLRDRATHTGTQPASSISDFDAEADQRVQAGINAHVSQLDPHTQYTTVLEAAAAAPVQSVAGKTGPVTLNKSDVGLSAVDNTSDLSKPVSVAQAAAIQAMVENTISSGEAEKAPSQDAVFEALAEKLSRSGDTMDGPIDVLGDSVGSGHIVLRPQNNKPATPTSGVALHSNDTENLAWVGQNGYQTVLDTSLQSEDRVLQLPDINAPLLADPMTGAGDMIYRNISNETARLPAGNEDEILRMAGGVPVWLEENLGQDFGGGSDGNVTINGVVTLQNPGYYNTLIMAPGGALITNGYPVYIKTLDLSNCDAGCIRWNGNNGANSGSGSGGSGGAALSLAMVQGASAGGAGAAATTGVGAQAPAATNASPSNGGAGGSGGQGGFANGGATIGGTPRVGGSSTLFVEFDRFEQAFLRGATPILGGAPGAGGSSGAGDGTNTGRGGGGGGSGAGIVPLYVQRLITSASTPAGAIQANGGNGGSQTAAPAGNAGGGAGAGGGGGGYLYLAILEKEGPTVSNLLEANGGKGGNGGNGSGTGLGGAGGQGGQGGRIRVYNAKTSTSLSVVGVTGSAGTLAVGIVGGVGGQGGLCQLSL